MHLIRDSLDEPRADADFGASPALSQDGGHETISESQRTLLKLAPYRGCARLPLESPSRVHRNDFVRVES